MQVQSTTREQRERSLRGRFQSAEALSAGEDPLVRLGALYHLGQKADLPEVRQKLLDLIGPAKPSTGRQSSPEETLFSLHAAVVLAQHGAFEGVEWILHQLHTAPTREERALAETALRNCSQFPLAVLLAQSLELSGLDALTGQMEDLMRSSEDELSAFGQKPGEEQLQRSSTLKTQIHGLRKVPRRAGRELVLGTVISWPIQRDFGYRFTGFVSVDRTGSPPLIVPFDLADVLNRDDRPMQQRYLLNRAGRRAIVAYNTSGNYEVQALYILPFAPLSEDEMEQVMTELALSSEGLDVAVVVVRWSDERGSKYRLLTTSGHTSVQFYRADQQRIGNCFLVHDLNSKPLSTRYQLSEANIAQVVRNFIHHTEIDQATEANTVKNRHYLVTRLGKAVTWLGELPKDFVYMVEETESGRFVFHLPGNLWRATDRSDILQSFFEKRQDAFGAVLETFKWQDGTLRARVVRAEDGEQKLKPIAEPVQLGTVAYWTKNDKNESFANIILDQRIEGGCTHCFGTQYRICAECAGRGKVTCPDCDGTRFTTCSNCGGDGKEACGHCDGGQRTITCRNCGGTGTWEADCRNCSGSGTYSGTCKVCQGSGTYADTGRTCRACGGDGSFTASCRRCSGTGSISGTCKRCEGQGNWTEECRTCGGSGRWDCRACHGRGEVPCDCDYGNVTCGTCNGSRISRCDCLGARPGKVVPVF